MTHDERRVAVAAAIGQVLMGDWEATGYSIKAELMCAADAALACMRAADRLPSEGLDPIRPTLPSYFPKMIVHVIPVPFNMTVQQAWDAITKGALLLHGPPEYGYCSRGGGWAVVAAEGDELIEIFPAD